MDSDRSLDKKKETTHEFLEDTCKASKETPDVEKAQAPKRKTPEAGKVRPVKT